MVKRGKYEISILGTHQKETVQGELYGEWWGIHKNAEQKLFVLTHIPSGKRVWSSVKKTKLVMLVQEPEFFDPPDILNPYYLKKLSQKIASFCDKNGWS